MKSQGKIRETFQSYKQAAAEQTLIELCGNRRVLIEHHKGITEYGRNSIKIMSTIGCICINGEDLMICCMSRERLLICGVIHAVELIEP